MAGGLGLRNRHRAWFQVEESLRVSTRGAPMSPPPPYGVGALGAHPDDEHHDPDDSAHEG